MPFLEIQSPDGETELRRLSRRSPVVIGRNPVNDICIDDESVAPILCRISWNGKDFEVTAVANDGVDVNGVFVRRKELVRGDVVRAGGSQFVFRRSSDVARAAAAGDPQALAAAGVVRKSRSKRDADAVETLEEGDWASPADDRSDGKAARPKHSTSRSSAETDDRLAADEVTDDGNADDEPVLLDNDAKSSAKDSEKTDGTKDAATKPATPGALARMRYTKRPGEQDILTSPLVLGLAGISLALLLAAGTFLFLMGREAPDRVYNPAVADREADRYAQAIRSYEQFLIDYPSDKRAAEARFALGLTRIESEAGGSSPDFEAAMQAFDDFVRGHRDLDGFDEQREPLRKLARQMTSGAAAAAIRTGERKYLDAAEESRQLFDRYAPTDASVDDVRQALTKSLKSATDAVRKKEFFDTSVATIDTAISANDFPTAFEARTNLLTRYPDLAGDKRMKSLLTRSLEVEKSLVKPEPPETAPPVGEPDGAAAAPAGLALVGHTQARAGEVSDGRLVFAVARDSLVGLDAVTGRPKWRTTIGLDTPFFPVAVDASVPALIAFDSGRNELLLLRREDGRPIWRTAVGATATGPPHITQGQIDLATSDGRLLRFVLETGEAVGAVRFPQPIVGPPVLAGDGERLVVFGEASTAYTLDLRSLAVEAVSYTGQSAGSIVVPPIALGKLLIVCENDQLESSVVRSFSVDAETGIVQPSAAARIAGRIYAVPMARGNMLYVPSSPERITPVSVSDDAGQPPLSKLEGTLIPEGRDVPLYLVPGPDGMLWAAGSALRKLRLVAKSLELLPETLAPGRHTQPPQESGESLFVARSLPSSPAVFVSQADRAAMTGSWRTVVGASIVGAATSDAAVTLMTDAGQAATVPLDAVNGDGFVDSKPLPQWDEDSPEPLQGVSFDDGRAAAWRGGASPQIWLASPGGPVGPPRPIAAGLQCPPVALEGGLALPLPGRLDWLGNGGSAAKVEAFLLPIESENGPAPKWRSAARIDPQQLVVSDDGGTLRIIRLRPEPLPHLAEIASLTLDEPPTRPIAAAGGRIAVASGSRLQTLDPSGLRTIAEATLAKPVVGGPWAIDELVLVQDESRTLAAYDAATLEERWKTTLDASVAGRPLRSESGWVIASRNGEIVELGNDGSENSRASLQSPLAELLSAGDRRIAVTVSGTLLPIPASVDQPENTTANVPATETPSDDATSPPAAAATPSDGPETADEPAPADEESSP